MRGMNTAFKNFECSGDTFVHVGVADVQAEVELQVRALQKIDQALGAGKLVRYVFQEDVHSSLARKQVDLLERAKCRIQLALVEFFLGDADMLDQITEWYDVGDVQRALNFIQHGQALGLHWFGQVDVGIRASPAPEVVAVHGRVQRVEF